MRARHRRSGWSISSPAAEGSPWELQKLRAARAAEVLRPTFLLVENVPAVRHDRGEVVAVATAALEAVGYTVASSVLDLVRFGVPQRRHRHILLGVLDDLVDPAVLLDM